MQFQFNSDYPSDDALAHDPLEFPPAQPMACARLTTRVQRSNGSIVVAENVLVRTTQQSMSRPSVTEQLLGMGGRRQNDPTTIDGRSNAGSLEQGMEMDDAALSDSSSDFGDDEQEDELLDDDPQPQLAYWIQRTIREAIYGRVLLALILEKKSDDNVWKVTGQRCAVKELDWQHIRKNRDRLAEDPIKEVSAMQYFKEWFASRSQMRKTEPVSVTTDDIDVVDESFRNMLKTNVMLPLDLLSDERYLYSITPFCSGGELFELLDMNERFTENESRYWMLQVLNVREVSHIMYMHYLY